VLGCGKWSNRWKHHGYPLPDVSVFTLQLDQRWAVPVNSMICYDCWVRHKDHTVDPGDRTRVMPVAAADGILSLLTAAQQASSSSPVFSAPNPFPSSSSYVSIASTSLPSSPLPSSPLPSSPSAPVSALSSHQFRPLGDISNLPPSKKRRLSTPLKEKQRVVRSVSDAATTVEKRVVMQRLGVTVKELKRYSDTIAKNSAADRENQRPLTAKRLSGGGRRTVLTRQQELDLRGWVMSLRRSVHRFRVTEMMIKFKAREMYGIQAKDKWVQGFMRRQNLSVRKKTTTKEVSTDRMMDIKYHWTNKKAELFASTNWTYLFNMDETSVFRDAPGEMTVDETGAKTVEIGTTQHDADRVAVVLACDRAGTLLPPLIIHKCYEKKRFKKTHKLFPKTISTSAGDFLLFVTYARKSWLNGRLMTLWANEIYNRHLQQHGIEIGRALLFMDNCSAHDNESTTEALAIAQIRSEFFPPNTTPILQPLDQNVNQRLKLEYRKLWEAWFSEKGCNNQTPTGNLRRATDDEVNGWVANALSTITPALVRECWQRTTDINHGISDQSHPRYQRLMTLPQRAWNLIVSYLGGQTALLPDRTPIRLAPYLTAYRTLYNGSRFTFPVARKRKRGESSEVAAAAMPGSEVSVEEVESEHQRLVDARTEQVEEDEDVPEDLPALLLPRLPAPAAATGRQRCRRVK
jgi:hypothetical protein